MPADDETLADDVARHILAGTDHPAVRWLDDRRAFSLLPRQFMPNSYLRAIRERRRRFRDLLRARLPGWREIQGNKWLPPAEGVKRVKR
jgi:hypothetical protein